MRKENSAIKKRLTSQIMDLKRQIVTKQAFDKGELIDEIQRLKKELAFANKQIYNRRVHAEGAGSASNANASANIELENSMKLVETITNQKRMLENENVELKSRISEMVNEKGANLAQMMDSRPSTHGNSQNRPGVPLLNLSPKTGSY